MKSYIVLLFSCAVLLACSKNETEESVYAGSLIGNWKEYEAYSDPGDGSGSFHEVDGIILTIKPDSTYTTSAEHFVWGRAGKISLLNDSTINIVNASQPSRPFPAIFSPTNAGIQFSYFCIEGCGSRFRKILSY